MHQAGCNVCRGTLSCVEYGCSFSSYWPGFVAKKKNFRCREHETVYCSVCEESRAEYFFLETEWKKAHERSAAKCLLCMFPEVLSCEVRLFPCDAKPPKSHHELLPFHHVELKQPDGLLASFDIFCKDVRHHKVSTFWILSHVPTAARLIAEIVRLQSYQRRSFIWNGHRKWVEIPTLHSRNSRRPQRNSECPFNRIVCTSFVPSRLPSAWCAWMAHLHTGKLVSSSSTVRMLHVCTVNCLTRVQISIRRGIRSFFGRSAQQCVFGD